MLSHDSHRDCLGFLGGAHSDAKARHAMDWWTAPGDWRLLDSSGDRGAVGLGDLIDRCLGHPDNAGLDRSVRLPALSLLRRECSVRPDY